MRRCLSVTQLRVKRLGRATQTTSGDFVSARSDCRQAEEHSISFTTDAATTVASRDHAAGTGTLRRQTRSCAPAGNAHWLALFDALAHQTPEDCWIESWSTVDGQPTLCGRAISAQTIQELARQLEQTLHSRAWQVHSPIIHKGDDGLLHFELRLMLPTHVPVEQTSSPTTNSGGTT